MATVIDALVVELGLDVNKFNSGATQAKKGMDGVTKGAKSTASSVDGASNALIKGAAAFGAFFGAALTISGLNAFVDKVTKMNTELSYTSKNLGTSAQALKEWQNTAELMGGTAEGVTSTMKSFSKAQTEMSVTGQTGMLPYMRALGVSMFDAQGKARPLGDMLLDLADRFKGMDRTQANNFGQMMGIDQATMNMLLEGRGAVQDMLETQKKMRKPTEDEVKASVELTKARAKLNQQFEGLEVVLVGAVTPALIFLTKSAEGFVGFLTENEQAVKAVFLGTSAVIGTVLIPTLWSATTAVLALIAPFLLVGAAVALAGVAVGLLLDDYITFTKGGKSVTGSFTAHFKDRWRDAGQSFKRIIEDFKAYWGDSVEFFKAGWRFIVAIFTGGSDEIRQAGEDLAEAFVKPFIRGFELIKDTYDTAKNFVTGKDKANEPAKPAETSEQKNERVTQEAKAIVQASGAGKAVGDAGVAIGGAIRGSALSKLIAGGESSSAGYEAYNAGTKNTGGKVRYGGRYAGLTNMSINEILASGDKGDGNTKGRIFAAGKYQFITPTLRGLKNNMGLSGDERFTPEMQERLFLENLPKAVKKYVNGKSSDLQAAQIALAAEWRSVADPRTGRTYADRGAGANKASISAEQSARALNEMRRMNVTGQATNFVSQSTNAQRLAGSTNNNSSKHVEVAINGVTVNTSANTLQGVVQAGFDASTRRMMIANNDIAMV